MENKLQIASDLSKLAGKPDLKQIFPRVSVQKTGWEQLEEAERKC